jgi:hypothetical protein
MKFEYKDKNYKTVKVEETTRITLQDGDGNRYRVTQNRFGGIEIMAEDGKLSIEPNVSNVVVLKTLT